MELFFNYFSKMELFFNNSNFLKSPFCQTFKRKKRLIYNLFSTHFFLKSNKKKVKATDLSIRCSLMANTREGIFMYLFPSKYIHEMRSPFPFPSPSFPLFSFIFLSLFPLNTLDIFFCFLGQALAKF